MQVILVNLDKNTCSIDIEPSDNYHTVAAKIQAQLDISPDVQKLLFAGKQLWTLANSMAALWISEESMIHITHRCPMQRLAK